MSCLEVEAILLLPDRYIGAYLSSALRVFHSTTKESGPFPVELQRFVGSKRS
jgi:hypothetical protein